MGMASGQEETLTSPSMFLRSCKLIQHEPKRKDDKENFRPDHMIKMFICPKYSTTRTKGRTKVLTI